ncbi:VOC family protein [Aestuariivirga sp.]|uniref:VOC family protein n=1 Tax=Aestuariivirga sp. TaxID=2650926 RepID=UPI0039E5716A
MSKIFVNLPVTNLSRSIAFYKALGFTQNLQFSDDTAACMVVSEENYVMLLTHEKFKGFSNAPIPDAHTKTGLMIALERDSREAVDAAATAALAAGGAEPRPAMDLGFMYNRTISDPDGHRWEPFFMDMSQAPQS